MFVYLFTFIFETFSEAFEANLTPKMIFNSSYALYNFVDIVIEISSCALTTWPPRHQWMRQFDYPSHDWIQLRVLMRRYFAT